MEKNNYIPHCPDPEKYVLVNTKEGSFWRRKRGSVKPAVLNAALKRNTKSLSIASPAASNIVDRLQHFIKGMETGRLFSRISGKLVKSLNASGEISFAGLEGFDIQKNYPLPKLYICHYKILRKKNEMIINIEADPYNVKPKMDKYITGYFFELVVIYGDPTDINKLRVDGEVSGNYPVEIPHDRDRLEYCRLSVQLPSGNIPWMMLLKLSFVEDNERPVELPKYHAMKVVKVGNGIPVSQIDEDV